MSIIVSIIKKKMIINDPSVSNLKWNLLLIFLLMTRLLMLSCVRTQR